MMKQEGEREGGGEALSLARSNEIQQGDDHRQSYHGCKAEMSTLGFPLDVIGRGWTGGSGQSKR
jgi:hypothetical protein